MSGPVRKTLNKSIIFGTHQTRETSVGLTVRKSFDDRPDYVNISIERQLANHRDLRQLAEWLNAMADVVEQAQLD